MQGRVVVEPRMPLLYGVRDLEPARRWIRSVKEQAFPIPFPMGFSEVAFRIPVANVYICTCHFDHGLPRRKEFCW